MPALTKTETALLAEIDRHPWRLAVVQFGTSRGEGRTGKLRAYGTRRWAAAVKLEKAGLVTIKRPPSYQTFHRGYGETHNEWTLSRAKAKG